MISKQKVLLVHGYKTTPNGAWFPWLMGEVKKYAVFAVSLDMPTPEVPLQEETVLRLAWPTLLLTVDIKCARLVSVNSHRHISLILVETWLHSGIVLAIGM